MFYFCKYPASWMMWFQLFVNDWSVGNCCRSKLTKIKIYYWMINIWSQIGSEHKKKIIHKLHVNDRINKHTIITAKYSSGIYCFKKLTLPFNSSSAWWCHPPLLILFLNLLSYQVCVKSISRHQFLMCSHLYRLK